MWIEPLEVVVVGGSTLHEADGCSRGAGGYRRAYLKLTAAAVGDDGGSGREQPGADKRVDRWCVGAVGGMIGFLGCAYLEQTAYHGLLTLVALGVETHRSADTEPA